MSEYRAQIAIFRWLLWRDCVVMTRDFWGRALNSILWPINAAVVDGYILPALGLSKTFGSFVLVGSILPICFFVGMERAYVIIEDFERERRIDYELMLPISPTLIFLRKSLASGIQSGFLSVPMLPLGRLVLWDRFGATHLHVGWFLTIFVAVHACFGVFSVFIASFSHTETFSNVWTRLLDPMWFFGCYLFSWQTLHKTLPWVAYANFINPVIYGMEGLRATIFGQEGYLDVRLCLLMLCLLGSGMFFWAMRFLRKRLDYV